MNIQGSNISGSYNSTSKSETVVKKTEDRPQSQRILSNNVKVTYSNAPKARKMDDNFGKSSYVTYSEKLKKQSKSYSAAASNADDGAKLIQAATDALKETEAILNRMKEISDQAADASMATHDRQVLQQELNSLASTINDISDTTTYDNMKIFDGDGSTKVYKPAPAEDEVEDITTILQTFVAATFDDKGNTFYKANSTDALSKEDAMKELQSGNSIYMTGAMTQTEYIPDSNNPALGENASNAGTASSSLYEMAASYTIANTTDTYEFSKLELYIKKDGNEYKKYSIKKDSNGLTSGQKITNDDLINALQRDSVFNEFFTVTKNKDNSLTISSKDESKGLVGSFALQKGYTATITTSNTPVTPSNPPADLYSLGGTKKLSSSDAANKLANGEKLYTNAYVAQTKAENNKDYVYTPSKTVLHEVTTTVKKEPAEQKPTAVSYKTLNFQLNAEGSKYASARIDRMDSDAIGVTNLNIANAKAAEKSGKRIDSALEQVGSQREYLSSIGGRLKEAAAVNDKNASNVKEGQKMDAINNPVSVESKEDIYAQLQQTILDNATSASEEAIKLFGSQAASEEVQQ